MMSMEKLVWYFCCLVGKEFLPLSPSLFLSFFFLSPSISSSHLIYFSPFSYFSPFPSLSFLSPILPSSIPFLSSLPLPPLISFSLLPPSLSFLFFFFCLSVSFSPFLTFFFSSVMTLNPLFG